MRDSFVYVGNWDRRKLPAQNGFGICSYDRSSGRLGFMRTQFEEISVGAACLHPTRNILYCTDEVSTLPEHYQGGGGQLYALAIDPTTGLLTEVNHCPSFGSLPSSLVIDPTGRFLVATHHTDRVAVTKVARDDSGGYRLCLEYDDATTVLFPLDQDGLIGEPLDVLLHSGSGGPLRRQTHPQLHSVTMAPSGSFFVVCDKGNDELVPLRINASTKKIERLGVSVKTPPGSSPRYVAFHPCEPYLFVNYEMKAIVSSFRYSEDGSLEHVVTVSALPAEVEDNFAMKQSDIVVHPGGKVLYSLLRGISAIAIFRIDRASGKIGRTETIPLAGKGPRACAISPDGRFLIVAALESGLVLTYSIDEGGRLTAILGQVQLPHPGTVTFF